MCDSTPQRASLRVERYRKASRALWDKPTSPALALVLREAERDLTENDWKWVRGEWHDSR